MLRSFKWGKKGRIFVTDKSFEWSQTHATLPTPYLIDENTLRIFYTSRDIEQKSRISYIDVNPSNPQEIFLINKTPILELGELGTFDDRGMTSSFLLKINEKLYFYYNGYNIGSIARYRIAIGLAINDNINSEFKKISNGPIMDRSIEDPCGCATPCIIFEDGIYKMWYSSFVKWELIDGDAEPYYRIAYAESEDAIHWKSINNACIDFCNDEGGIVRPTVIKLDNIYYMWFSVRKNTAYRNIKENTYRIGFASSINGIDWNRMDDKSGIELSESGWDSEMICYPQVFKYNNRLYMFYNGNGFGQSGFGYAEYEINNNINLKIK